MSTEKSFSKIPLIRRRPSSRLQSSRISGISENEEKTVTAFEPPEEEERRYRNLDEILASFGNWHPFFRRKILFSFLIHLSCQLCYASIDTIRNAAMTPLVPNDSYCHCAYEEHALHQKAARDTLPFIYDQSDIEADSTAFTSAIFWGNTVGLGLLFLCNSWGRRLVIGFSVTISGLSTIGVFYFATVSTTQTRLVVFFHSAAIILSDIVISINLLEWIPSAARPLAVLCHLWSVNLASILNSLIMYYAFSYSPFVLILYGLITIILGIVVFLFYQDSPYYHLMTHSTDSLHKSILSIAGHQKGVTEKDDLAVDDAIDDVAFENFEGNDTIVDAMMRMFSNLKVMRNLVILMLSSTVVTFLNAFVDPTKSGHFKWGIFHGPVRFSIFTASGYLLGFLITGRRRALTMSTSLALTGLLLVIIYPIVGEKQWNTCTMSYVSRDAAGYAVLVLTILAEMIKRTFDFAFLLFSSEYFPTAIRPTVLAFQYMPMSSLVLIFKQFSNLLRSQGVYWENLLPIILCAVMSVLCLFLHLKPTPMSAWYADLEKKERKVRDFAGPVLISQPEKETVNMK